ncbi:hypothetical protein SHI21_11240 [Bacteriovorax sp. PP10]|uniref:Uncharacterized protein n=1 Tax=Bacteriovorax antarcticus TaxID=3088717 RepID=A0ABU5VUP6_9BACT|nr:hypothetical protein [Bacteriovorax sp. PP10]MEA9356785.1 hypothetical protein [Bacteriovorax sp. PP10]
MFKKMMMLFLMGFSISVLADENLMGGDRVGNGGDVVVCGKKIELLDIYEARTSGYEIKRPVGKTYQEMIKSLLQTNLLPIQPKRTAKYLKFLESFESEAQFLPGIKLSDVDDAGMVAIPTGCELKQIAIQLSDDERPAGKKRYTVSLDLWNKLDEFNKMSLILHEIIYREAIEHKSSNSMVVRATVGEILKTKLDLNVFLSLVADLSDAIEYKNYRWKVCELCKPVITIFTNEYNEQVVKIEDTSLELEIDGRMTSTPYVELRIFDGKILMSNIARFLRAGKPSIFLWESGKLIITASQDLDYFSSSFVNPKNASVRFEYLNEKSYILDFKQVNELSWQNGFRGQFNLEYNEITLNDPEYSYIKVSDSGVIIGYAQKNNLIKHNFKGSVFNCRAYEENINWYVFSYCKAGTQLEVTFPKEKVRVSLLQDVNKFFYSKYTDYGIVSINDLTTVYTDKPIYLGKDFSNKDVFLGIGEFKIINSRSYYDFYDDKFHYSLEDGYVSLTPIN